MFWSYFSFKFQTYLGSLKNQRATRILKCTRTATCWNDIGPSSAYFVFNNFWMAFFDPTLTLDLFHGSPVCKEKRRLGIFSRISDNWPIKGMRKTLTLFSKPTNEIELKPCPDKTKVDNSNWHCKGHPRGKIEWCLASKQCSNHTLESFYMKMPYPSIFELADISSFPTIVAMIHDKVHQASK